MGNVKVIAANPTKAHSLKGIIKKILRVCAYCRVSTGTEEQKTSYESQIKYYKQKIKQNEDWELVDIYADEAISGTQVFKRVNFKRMIDDALAGKIDLILVKSISRFGRNTVDILKYIRLLKEHGVAVYFEEENINTMKMQGEILLTVLSALAQQGSATISSSVALGARMKMKRGELVGHYAPFGYRYDQDKEKLVICEEEAEVVKEIYRLYIEEGLGTARIARTLNNRKISSPTNKMWSSTVVARMIRNEKYCGDLLTGKTYTADPISKKKIINHGEKDKYYTKNHHEAIIPRETWDKANALLNKRTCEYKEKNKLNKESHMYPFSSMIDCGCCGQKFIRRSWSPHKEGQPRRVAWACRTFQKRNDDYCQNIGNVKESIIEEAFVEAYNNVCQNHTIIINQLLDTVEEIISTNNYDKEVNKIKEQIENLKVRQSNLVDMKLDGIIDGNIYVQKNEELKNKILLLEEKLDEYKNVIKDEKNIQERIAEFKRIFKKKNILSEFDATVFSSITERIIIGEKDENDKLNPNVIKFIFKNGSESTNTLPTKSNSKQTIIEKYMDNIKEQMNTSTKNNEDLEEENSSDSVAKKEDDINEYNNENERKLFQPNGAYCDNDKYSYC
ncbi:MAG: recombinase family protein [Bacilli bacterium]|nr:recombinase family protein [Bacilli bacterium]